MPDQLVAHILGHRIPVDLGAAVVISVDVDTSSVRLEFRETLDPPVDPNEVTVATFQGVIELSVWNVNANPWDALISIEEGPSDGWKLERNALRRTGGPFEGHAILGHAPPRRVWLLCPGMELTFLYSGRVEWQS